MILSDRSLDLNVMGLEEESGNLDISVQTIVTKLLTRRKGVDF